jgi:hypothetical protein
MERKIDPFTGEEFVPKRSNQKFANAKNKNDYHNRKNRKIRHEEAPILNALKKNRAILVALMIGKKEKVFSKEFLRGAGFNLKIYNGNDLESKELLTIVFEYSLKVQSDKMIKVTKNERFYGN